VKTYKSGLIEACFGRIIKVQPFQFRVKLALPKWIQ